MPLEKVTRILVENSIVSYLLKNKPGKEASSEEICNWLKKEIEFIAVHTTKQTSMVCRTLERKGILLSQKHKGLKFWRLNPHFYTEHPREGRFDTSLSSEERFEKMKRRTKAHKKT